ncbi:Chorion peroxidase [Amphibalanus amphitrite]|uniref:Chorion peroxidase n=1 Tax=Amphibalanus amphitrite TaxID=1232801 RepID=A0A6A4X5M0_AMPAM|nr:Chorion peroxidase [Amphibalanus amphitrite]
MDGRAIPLEQLMDKCLILELRPRPTSSRGPPTTGVDPSGRYECPVCGARLLSQALLVRHARGHGVVALFGCVVCGIPFTERSLLVYHALGHVGGRRPWACGVCGEVFERTRSLKRHILQHDGRWDCPECGDTFHDRDSLEQHALLHGVVNPYLCEVAVLAVFGTSGTGVAAQCDCRTASGCPQAYYLGTATGCYLQGTRNLVTTGQTAAADSPTELFNFNSQSTNEIQQLGLQALQSLETFTNLAVTGGGAAGAFVGSTASAGFGGSASQSFGQGSNFQGQGFPNQGGFQTGSLRPTGEGFQTTMDPTCTPEPPITCSNSLYRTVTGECNNLLNPRLGKARTGFKRLLPNTFDDGIFAIRTRAVRGGTLPTARFISERVLDVFSNELRQHTLSLMQIGQFADHDLTHALIFRLPNETGIECCQKDGETYPPTLLHPQCIPIPIPANDPFYSRYRQRCMNLVRSLPAPAPDCVARPARPLNELTSFIDGSNVYGSSEEETRNLRAFQHGLLRESAHRLLPLDQRPDKPCRRDTCFHAGDTRVNEQSLLAVTHTIWMREHNRIARALQARHSRWGDEQLYQEARRVLVAEWQHILYNEWLPVLIGFKYAEDHGLLPLQAGYSNHYDHRIDPTISNSFATAAFRFGHTMVRDMYDILDANGIVVGSFNLSSTFFDPTVIAHGITDHARTMVAMRSETFDTFFARSLHEQLFTTNHLYGLDLLALNIQRGRDHGTPTYAQVAEACRLVPSVRFWGDLHALMDSTVIDRLRSVYDDPWDVDLFIGGVSERLAPGAQVGPTFQCLIGQQFFDLRYGDRFFYDNGGQPHSFSLPQLSQIRRASWARIMCDTLGPEFLNDFHHVQPLAVLTPGGQNQIVSCDSLAIPRVDLGVF